VRVAIIGGGVAGTAAAWALRRAGADATVFFDRPGASSLYSGALDVASWEGDALDAPVPAEVIAFAAAFDAWSLGTRSCRVATHDGVARAARGADTALLDLTSMAGKTVVVTDCPIDGWDGPAIARALAASRWAVRTGTHFESAKVVGVVDPDESRGSWFDVAALHDAEGRLTNLAERLRDANSRADGWLLGPWLGTTPGPAEKLRALLGKPCGETTSPPGGAAGARFEASRDALFEATGVHVRRGLIDSLEVRGERHHPRSVATRAITVTDAGFDAVVVAAGGLVGGGIALTSEGFQLSIAGPLFIGLGGRVLGPSSSSHGVDLAALGPSGLERVGILTDGARGGRGASGIFVAGDCVEGRPRTALEAASAGIAAASRALKR
jgi:anaerobic glycerol-3-phosphate dehydrogenase